VSQATGPVPVRQLLVDARALDHPTAGQRGIGRWVRGFLQGLVQIGAPFTALYSSDEQAEILTSEVAGAPVQHWGTLSAEQAAYRSGTWYIATQMLLHPVSLDPIPSVITHARLAVAAVMYDVIPYRHPDRYQQHPSASALARIRASLMRTTDAMLAISAFSAETAGQILDYPHGRIAVIGSGVDAVFVERHRRALALPHSVPAGARYVVAVTGSDDRKNTEGLIRAWSMLPSELRESRRLVIATGVPAQVEARWRAVADEVAVTDQLVITGSITDEEMVAILQHAELSVTPSFEEGFGLPVVEAAACGCPVVCSNLSSLPEVLDQPEATFDPADPQSIAATIERALCDESYRAVLIGAAERASKRWTWSNAAQRTLAALEQLGPRWQRPPRSEPNGG